VGISTPNSSSGSESSAPTIATQPVSQSVTVGQSAIFTVGADGTAPLSFQWQKNNANIAGATSGSYKTPAATMADSGSSYRVVVSNTKGSATSGAVMLTVSATTVAPTVTTQPANQTVTSGQTASFAVTANGTAPLSYQWQKNGANISGATSASYATPATTTGDSGSTYRVVVSNSAGTATSNAATLTVSAAPGSSAVAPTITTQPANQTVTAGQTASFAVTANGTAPLIYQWQKNGANISGATSASYTTPATTTGDSGSTYRVVVSNTKGSATSGAVTLTVSATTVAPTITTQPANRTVTAGQTASFAVTANGTAPLSYQWQKNGANISGATSASYTTPATTTGDSGSTYRVVVSNSAGTATSNAATLTVSAATVAPTITTQPANRTVTAGQTASFAITANGTAPLSYQWQKNGANISGATSASYTTPATTTGDSGSTYRVVVSNSAGTATSNAATLTVSAATGSAVVAPTITTQPANQIVTAGQTASFAVTANGTAPLSYQWQKNGANISGATSASYTTPATTGDSGSTYRVVVSNSAGTATSNAATLTVSAAAAAPTITTQPASRTVTAGQTASFAITANGTAPLSYQWQKNGANISGATSASYTTPATTTGDSGSTYRVVVSNSAGTATSNAATLTVSAAAVAPTITTQPANQTVTAGQTASFAVTANGTAPLSYQWQKNGANISGATSASYTTPATTTGDSGSTYRVVVSNSAGTATSNAATLTVSAATVAPTITTQPASRTVTAGQTASFAVTANGTAPLSYQWQKNGANISGATSASYTTPATTTGDSGSTYRVVVSNSAGTATSNAATLTVSAAPGTLKSYTTNFPLTENPISEGGNWINGSTLGLDWANVRTTSGLAFGTESGSGGYDDSTAVLTGTWNSDQMAQAVVHSVNQNGNVFEEVELRLRTTIVAHSITGYEFNFRALSSGDTYVQIVRWNGPFGSFSVLNGMVGPGIRDGDVIKATAVGNTLTGYVNGAQVVQATDSTFMNGSPGIAFFNQGGTIGLNADYGFTSFYAAEISGSAPAAALTKLAVNGETSLLAANNLATISTSPTSSTVNVLTYHNDDARTGQNMQETILTPSTVKSARFGKKGFLPVQGAVDAEPLYVSNLLVGGAPHNVVFVATEHDLVYAFDADTLTQLWRVSVVGPNETPSDNRGCDQITPEIGITATPVIDLNAGPHGTIFVVAMSKDTSGNYYQRLHSLDLSTGAEQSGSPTTIAAAFPTSTGILKFDPAQYKESTGLLLLNGMIYLSWAPHCDHTPYNSWVMGYNETTLKQVSVLNLTPNGSAGSVSNDLAADDFGNIYFLTAHGTFDTTLDARGYPANGDYGNAFMKLSTRSNSLGVSDYFAAYNSGLQSSADLDSGSGGVLLLPDLADDLGNTRKLAVGARKDAIYVVNRESMGKFNPDNDNAIYQKISLNGLGSGAGGGMPAYFNNTIYYGAANDALKAFSVNNARLASDPASQSAGAFAYPGTTPSISANGTSDGIVWTVENNGSSSILHAYDATNLANELYNSTQAGTQDQFVGGKFITPMIANGKVYVGSPTGVIVFALLN
jgi:hypothetical protein